MSDLKMRYAHKAFSRPPGRANKLIQKPGAVEFETCTLESLETCTGWDSGISHVPDFADLFLVASTL